jgi:hypothetical protein
VPILALASYRGVSVTSPRHRGYAFDPRVLEGPSSRPPDGALGGGRSPRQGSTGVDATRARKVARYARPCVGRLTASTSSATSCGAWTGSATHRGHRPSPALAGSLGSTKANLPPTMTAVRACRVAWLGEAHLGLHERGGDADEDLSADTAEYVRRRLEPGSPVRIELVRCRVGHGGDQLRAVPADQRAVLALRYADDLAEELALPRRFGALGTTGPPATSPWT